MSTPLRILLIRPSALGDVARSVPVLVSLRSAYPEAKISWLLQDGFEDVVRTHPALSAIVPFPRKQLARWWTPRGLRDSFAFLNSLRGKFDLVVDAQGLFRSGLFAWSTRAPRRIGFRDAKECAAIFYNERIRNEATESNRHAVQRMLSLLEGASIPTVRDSRLYTPPDAQERWSDFARREGISGRTALLATTSRWASKDWPRSHWRSLAEALLARGYERILFTGTASERAQVAAAMPEGRARLSSIDLAGRTDLGMTMAAIQSSALVISNDSAALHIAAGLQRPLLSLFGPTDPRESAPFQRQASVVQSRLAAEFLALGGHYRDRKIGDKIMQGIEVHDVLSALDAAQHLAGLSESSVALVEEGIA